MWTLEVSGMEKLYVCTDHLVLLGSHI